MHYPPHLVVDVEVVSGAWLYDWAGILIFRCPGILGQSLSEIVIHFSTFRFSCSASGASEALYFVALALAEGGFVICKRIVKNENQDQ